MTQNETPEREEQEKARSLEIFQWLPKENVCSHETNEVHEWKQRSHVGQWRFWCFHQQYAHPEVIIHRHHILPTQGMQQSSFSHSRLKKLNTHRYKMFHWCTAQSYIRQINMGDGMMETFTMQLSAFAGLELGGLTDIITNIREEKWYLYRTENWNWNWNLKQTPKERRKSRRECRRCWEAFRLKKWKLTKRRWIKRQLVENTEKKQQNPLHIHSFPPFSLCKE